MELCVFHSNIYGKKDGQLFVFEPTWDSFRPIEKVGWDGIKYSIVDRKYKADLFDQNYGYGSLQMKALCRQLSQTSELEEAKEITDPVSFWKWCGETEAKWFYDRACVFSNSCISRDTNGWKKYLHYLNVRAKTLKNTVRGRITRRLVPRERKSTK
jgi:hypothetical protein